MLGHMSKVVVPRQQLEVMSNTKLADECINRPYLDALASTMVSPSSRFDVVIDLRCDDGEQRKTLYDPVGCFRTLETLEQFL